MAKLDENPELILEPEQRITRSLDHQICAITLRPVTNHFANGYGVAVSAKFGVERLRLMIDDEEISFKFSIYKAEVMLDRAKCDPDTQFTPDKTALVERKLSEAETQVHLNGGVGGVKHGHKWKSSYQFSKTDEALTIESCGSPKVPLRGQLLDEFVGWRVKPHLGVNSGVLGRVRVREDWIELVEPEHHAGPRRIFDKMWAYLTGEGNDAESRRKKFSALLARLVSEALQDVAEMRDATLAMDTIIVR
ncbi:hypothetical protein, partial [Yoonia sp.]